MYHWRVPRGADHVPCRYWTRTLQVPDTYLAGTGHVPRKCTSQVSDTYVCTSQVPDSYPTDTGHVCTSQLASTGHVPSRWYRLVFGAVTCTEGHFVVVFLPRLPTSQYRSNYLYIYLQIVTRYFFSNPVWETSAPATDLEVRGIGP